MKIIPYIEIDGAWTFSDSYMARLYRQMEEEGTARRVFHGGTVQTPEQFVKWLKNRAAVSAIVILDEADAPLALCWIGAIEDRRAWYNFNIFKKAWGRQSAELAIAAKEFWFGLKDKEGQPLLDVLAGLTPEQNRLALRLMEKCGAKRLGTIPNFMTNHWTGERGGGVISYIER